MASLTNKVAVVTGAAQGIGEEITIELTAVGAAVAVHYATSNKAADRVVDRTGRLRPERIRSEPFHV